jgi:prepilin-type processing-associated H-X9-DG protein
MKRNLLILAVVSVLAMVVGMLPAIATDGNLPGGTSISVTIDNPADGTEFVIPVGDTTLDIGNVDGTAAVGEGTPIKDTTVVYAIDVSGSAGLTAGVDCDGIVGNDTVLTCEKEGVYAANAAAADANSAILNSGVVAFRGTAAALGVPVALLSIPGPNIDAAVAFLAPGGGTNYSDAIAKANIVFADGAVATNKVLIFITDGIDGFGAPPLPLGTVVSSFAVGTGSSCSASLLAVTALGAAGSTCEEVTDPSDLADAITESIGSTLDSLDLEVDGGGATAIPNADITPDLPLDGADSVVYDTPVGAALSAGTHEICVTANGTDAAGSGDVTDCVNVELIQTVDIDIKPGSFPNSININKKKGVIPVAILGSDTFDVTLIDVTTLLFAGTTPTHDLTDPLVYAEHLQDVNGDGLTDLVSHYSTPDSDLVAGDTEACITADFNGASLVGCDSVRTVPAG